MKISNNICITYSKTFNHSLHTECIEHALDCKGQTHNLIYVHIKVLKTAY